MAVRNLHGGKAVVVADLWLEMLKALIKVGVVLDEDMGQ